MNGRIKELAIKSQLVDQHDEKLLTGWMGHADLSEYIEEFAKLIVEETMREVDERTMCHGQNSWSDHDKQWIRLHFGYGELENARSNTRVS